MSLREKLLKKNWSNEELEKYVGCVKNAFLSYALDKNVLGGCHERIVPWLGSGLTVDQNVPVP